MDKLNLERKEFREIERGYPLKQLGILVYMVAMYWMAEILYNREFKESDEKNGMNWEQVIGTMTLFMLMFIFIIVALLEMLWISHMMTRPHTR